MDDRKIHQASERATDRATEQARDEYLITGATGFLGRHLLERLLARGVTVHAVVRAGSRGRLARIRASLGDAAERVVTHVGDLEEPRLGLVPAPARVRHPSPG